MSNVHSDLDEVVDAELDLLSPDVRQDAAAVDALLAEDFREVGRSGRVRDRAATVAALVAERGTDLIETHDVVAERLAEHVVLLTYATAVDGDRALRCSVWVQGDDGCWRIRYHQGTSAADR